MLASEIKTPSDLKLFVDDTGSLFFSRQTMKFFGDTMKNFGLCRKLVTSRNGEEVNAYCLFRIAKTSKGAPVKEWYFHPETFKQVYAKLPESTL